MKLNYKHFGSGQPLIIMHGLFGSLDNWVTLSKKLASHFEVFIVDARNHGFSPHHNEFNYDVMADDLYAFMLDHHLTEPIVLGHSMGGKTAMQFAMNYPNMLEKLIVADIAPKAYPVHHETILKGMFALDFEIIRSRKKADEELSKHIGDFSTRQFILKNLYWKDKNTLDWKFNLRVINTNIVKIGSELQNQNTFNKPTLFIRGDRSNYILETDYPNILTTFPKAQIKTMACGHWLHAENPTLFLNHTLNFLNIEGIIR